MESDPLSVNDTSAPRDFGKKEVRLGERNDEALLATDFEEAVQDAEEVRITRSKSMKSSIQALKVLL